jgi:TolA-binding protein
MRSRLLLLVLMAGIAAPAVAQQPARQSTRQQPIERRVQTLEEQLRAVQRRVFPAGNVEPEISTAAIPGGPAGTPATSPVADLTSRVDALEAQLARLTGQAEANDNRLRQIEEAMNRLRDSVGARLDVLERAPAEVPTATLVPPSVSRPASRPPATSPATTTPSRTTEPAATATTPGGDPEEAYNEGFRLWEAKRYTEAQRALEAMARNHPRHRLASWAKNLAGRAYLDEGKPATAARMFLANYQDNPRGERAADSLFFLGQALAKLNKPADACKAYDELQDVYGATMRDWLKQRLPAARSESSCR